MEIDEDFLDTKYALWSARAFQTTEFMEKCEKNLMESIDVDALIGSVDKLNKDFITKLKENNLSEDDGFEIRKHIIRALYKKQISKKSTPRRISYLLKHFDKTDFECGQFDEFTETCPFCGFDIPDNYNSCPQCGLHIRDIDFEEHFIRKNLKLRYFIIAFFFFIIYKIIKLFKRK